MSKALDRLFADLPSRLSVEQLTDILGLSEKTVTYRWLREGRVPAIRLGGTWIIFRDDVREHLEAHYNTPKPSSETTELDPPENPEGT
ncbi:excisionase family DNA binding protein [Arthrobacter sp. CAN_A214]|uniref:helix-turn-helix domain-containing protein n=1 Tax=Arthrobacter sp. CAN_A214 TaxID=2787720 RepID=UPI0018C962F0